MSRLFLELYLDEDVDVVIADLLRARGFTANTTQLAKQIGATDRQQLEYATNHEMVLLTHNRVHFERLAQQYFQTGLNHAGIIIATRRRPHEIAQRLLVLLDQVTADEMKNQIRYI